MRSTQIQTGHLGKLFHVQTNTYIDLLPNLSIIHIGKPNERIPPDIDVSPLPNSHFVSRVHASGGIVLPSITLLSFLLEFGAFSAGYQLFTSGRVSVIDLLPLKGILRK